MNNTEFRAGAEDDLVGRLTALLDQQADRAAGAEPVEPSDGKFDALAVELRSAATWTDPPVDLRERILARALRPPAAGPVAAPDATVTEIGIETAPEVEVGAPPVAGPVPEPAPPVGEVGEPAPERAARPRRSWWPAFPRQRWGRLAWAVPAAALAAAMFTGGVLAVDRALQPDRPPVAVYAATGTSLAPEATAVMSVWENGSGFSVVLESEGLPAAAPGSYYAAWLRGPRGTVPLGSFHERRAGDQVELWSGVDPADYSTLVVTLQAEGDPAGPSELVVMAASLTD